ncbi:DNA phosphorothioation-dependent restriction protein DptG [Acinetobacter courvalinii]|uniref:DNA phosphorothioation-dependent restriction protein DptG n=1 Tax=Acinetobacter courvalinii TaxID=280147 RepID=UPI0039C99DBF
MNLDLKLKVAKKNIMGSFYPVGTRGESKGFDWDILTNLFICEIYGLDISSSSKVEQKLNDFENYCRSSFIQALDDPRAWDHLKKIYFDERNLVLISPKLCIYSIVDKIDSANVEKRFLGLIKTLLKAGKIYQNYSEQLNFLEKIITKNFDKKFETKVSNETLFVNYLPSLAEIFSNDLEFLIKYPKYFIENIQLFIQIYICIYTIQLSLTINSWQSFKDQHLLQCYFILDFEKASQERNLLIQRGYKAVEKELSSIFPVLAMTESLQSALKDKQPLWKFFEKINDVDLDELNKYCEDFALERKLTLKTEKLTTHLETLKELEGLFKAQFSKTENSSERAGRNDNVVKDIKNIILKPFIKARGRVGNLFVLNQEYLLLLTNLVIGENEQLRLYELIKGFEKRGIFFDRESHKALVLFYERLGNIEKMSDSGDAIYVKKTI